MFCLYIKRQLVLSLKDGLWGSEDGGWGSRWMRFEAAIGESFKLAKQVGNKEQADGRAQGSLERRATEDAVRCPPTPHWTVLSQAGSRWLQL